jgi:hypothetical protein
MSKVLNKKNLPYFTAGAVFIVIIIIALGDATLTGNSTRGACSDDEAWRNPYERGTVTFLKDGVAKPYVDECVITPYIESNKVRDYYCTLPNKWGSEVIHCVNGCSEGACIR